MRRAAVAAWLVAAAVLVVSAADEPAPIELPLTLDKVWFRKGGGLLSKGGDLIVTEDGFEMLTGKRTVSIPMRDVYMLSFGKLKGDVDTEWAVLALGQDGPREIIGIRDGKKLGYGQRTERLYEQLKAALKLGRGGQYAVPEGFRAYDAVVHHCSLAIPDSWDTHVDQLIVTGEGKTWGTTIFSSEPIDPPTRGEGALARLEQDPDLIRVMSGEIPAFFLARREADPGMSCDKFSRKAQERILEIEKHDPLERLGYEIVDGPTATPTRVAFCNGLRVRARSRRPDGRLVELDLYATAHAGTYYLIGMRALEEHYDAFRKPLDVALETLRFSVAR